MAEISQIRESLIRFYKANEKWINPSIKFITGLIIFSAISTLGAPSKFSTVPIIILLSILTVVLPISLISFLAIIMIVMQLMFVSIELAVIAGTILLCIQLFYIRVFPKESIMIFIMLLAYYLKVPYWAVFIAAMFFGFSSIVPVAIGTFLWYCISIVKGSLATGGTALSAISDADLLDIPTALAKIYTELLSQLSTDQTWIISIIIFAMVIAIVHIVAQLEVDFSHYLAIGVGSVVSIIGFVLAALVASIHVNLLGVIIFTAISAILAMIVQFFVRVLDYASSERVQFEDDEYYYYVKVIPKVLVSRPKKH